MKLDVLIDMFFTDLPWEERVRKIAACGCAHFETWQGADGALLKRMADAGKKCGAGLVSIVMNGIMDHKTAPIRGENLDRFVAQMDRCADNALAAGCRQGIVTTGQTAPDRDAASQRAALVNALRAAGERLADRSFRLNLEPLNTVIDHKGYFLDDPRDGVTIVKEVGLPNVKMLYDIYHMTIMTGNQTVFLEKNIEAIGHFHAAGVPGRHEPFNGETNYPFMLKRIAAAGYADFIGLEYSPQLPCEESLVKSLEYMRA
jgi:hydroxypyruvate isomerase